MKRSSKTMLTALIVAAGLLLAGGVFVVMSWWDAVSSFRDMGRRVGLTPAEEKAMAERVLAMPFAGGAIHDAALSLMHVGEVGSIPSLLKALKSQADTPPDGYMVCTKAHCLKALRGITGHDAGCNYAEWAEWWSEIGSRLPPEAFPLKETTLVVEPARILDYTAEIEEDP